MSSMLAEAGFKVAEASNGMSALRMALDAQPQIVVIGRGLPEISAADVMRSLNSDHRMRHTAVVQVENPCNAIELLATVVSALEARHELQHRGRAGTPRAAKVQPWLDSRLPAPSARTSAAARVAAARGHSTISAA
jgi:DNA-binding response OmpR family regulator